MKNKEKNIIIERLQTKDRRRKIYHSSVPEEYKEDKDIIDVERKIGMRKIDRIGFDVINQVYFVHEFVLDYNEFRQEEIWRKSLKVFDDFSGYFDYLNGEIYENACYYQCDLSKIKKKVDKSRMSEKISFVEDCIDDYVITPSDEELLQYQEGERRKKQVKKWIDKFIACDTFAKLRKVVESYNKSVLSKENDIDVVFFFWQYIFYDLNDKTRFDVIMQYMSSGYYPEYRIIRPLCHIYNPEDVLANYNYSLGVKQTCDKHKRNLRKYVESLSNAEYENANETEVRFDEKTHYYCESDSYGVHRFFETFEELIKYRKNDLSDADLTKDIQLDYDFSACKTNENTKLPIGNSGDLEYVIKKKYSDGKFKVLQAWYNKNDVPVKHYIHEFEYFFDFVAFLKGDLSGADLLLCDGLRNLDDVSGIDFSDARITSSICDKFGIKYKSYSIDLEKVESFSKTEEYERSTALVLQASRELATSGEAGSLGFLGYDSTKERVSYISDLHLMHKLEHFKPKSKADVVYVIQTIVNSIVAETNSILLIGGDVASDYTIFELFIRLLRDELDRRRRNPKVIFILGNHELWEFPSLTFDSIVEKYEKLISECGMYLLQNDILYKDSERRIHRITNEELISSSEKEVRDRLRDARIIFFGGLAFSGYNEQFNANNGIYRKTISRDEEIRQSKCFEELYNKVLGILPDRKIVVFTHTPMDCWSEKVNYHKEYVYVSGHTHRNQFYDDGETRIYADNQIGYSNNNPHLKWLEMDNEYDYFTDYEDGIHQITADDYRSFYRGKNIMITFNREVNVLYMLKKNGYYCFIHQSKGGSLTMLNGGALKKLNEWDINYYYDNMDMVVSAIKKPLDKYSSIQEKIAAEIRKLGGDGTIHGCIIDIDWYNHVYVNPVDMKITGYWASDIINKKIYPNVPALLEKECPSMYAKYTKLLKGSSKNLPMISNGAGTEISVLPQTYLDTDIYKASREIKKMQKLSSNILTTWYEVDNGRKMIESKKK